MLTSCEPKFNLDKTHSIDVSLSVVISHVSVPIETWTLAESEENFCPLIVKVVLSWLKVIGDIDVISGVLADVNANEQSSRHTARFPFT